MVTSEQFSSDIYYPIKTTLRYLLEQGISIIDNETLTSISTRYFYQFRNFFYYAILFTYIFFSFKKYTYVVLEAFKLSKILLKVV